MHVGAFLSLWSACLPFIGWHGRRIARVAGRRVDALRDRCAGIAHESAAAQDAQPGLAGDFIAQPNHFCTDFVHGVYTEHVRSNGNPRLGASHWVMGQVLVGNPHRCNLFRHGLTQGEMLVFIQMDTIDGAGGCNRPSVEKRATRFVGNLFNR